MLTKFDQSNLDGCMVQGAVPPEIVMAVFDNLTPEERHRINYSPFKLCTLCVGGGQSIGFMERAIRSWDHRRPQF